jgi:hypothetical protein
LLTWGSNTVSLAILMSTDVGINFIYTNDNNNLFRKAYCCSRWLIISAQCNSSRLLTDYRVWNVVMKTWAPIDFILSLHTPSHFDTETCTSRCMCIVRTIVMIASFFNSYCLQAWQITLTGKKTCVTFDIIIILVPISFNEQSFVPLDSTRVFLHI